MTGGVDPGWYPDYDAPAGHQRYWDGEQWTERRSTTSAAPPEQSRSGVAPWVLAAVAVLVVVSALAIVLGNRETGPSGATPPGPASTPGPPADDDTESPTASPDDDATVVASVVDGSTLRLTDGSAVRLLGITDSCGEDELTRMVVGEEVTLVLKGVDKDSDGALLRYVERDGLDVGQRLIQKGLARASDLPNPRRAIYRRIDARSPDVC